jgi:hypothetical protein
MRRTRIVCITAILISGCSKLPSSDALLTSPTPPTPVFVSAVALERRAMNGGGTTEGTITLNVPSAATATVALSSNTSAATVPAAVQLPAGLTTATFPVQTEPVASDTIAAITASIAGRETRAHLYVWTVEPTSFWYDSDLGEPLGAGRVAKLTPATHRFRAVCDASSLYSQVEDVRTEIWHANFHLPRPVPLRPGTWGFDRLDFSRPLLQLIGRNTACQAGGEFTIVTADLDTSGAVRHFVATFRYACPGIPGTLRGEIRLTNVPPGIGGGSPTRCSR